MRTIALMALLLALPLHAAEPYIKTEVRSLGLVANLYRPPSKGRAPAVLLLGGSGGGIGWQDSTADILARRGFAALALAYFAMDDLPPELERIPLEYVQHAVDYLRLQPFVDPERIAVVGVSKGSELALLLASMTPEIKAVVAFAPSAYVWQSVAKGFPETSSWTYRGREVPYLRYGSVQQPKSTAEIYRAGVDAGGPLLEQAAIPVEKINGPVLLLSGKDDNLWPSTAFSEAIVARLNAKQFAHRVEHIPYDNAGHLISSIRSDDVSRRGGTAEGNRLAQIDAQKRMIQFLETWASSSTKSKARVSRSSS